MDPLVRERLTAAGILDGDGFRRRVVKDTCPRCRRDILRGLDARTCGVPVTAEATPLDQLGELVALSHGARTYDLMAMHRPGGHTLEPRRPVHIAGGREFMVVATHRCALTWPTGVFPHTPALQQPENPPF